MTWLSNTIHVWGWITAICTIFMAFFRNENANKWLKVITKIANCFSVIKYKVKTDESKKKK